MSFPCSRWRSGQHWFAVPDSAVISLLAVAQQCNYTLPYWMTYKQARKYGGYVKKGQTSSVKIRFYPSAKANDSDSDAPADDTATTTVKPQWRPKPKWWPVFNVEQIADLPEHFYQVPDISQEFGTERDPKLDAFFAATGVEIIEHIDRAAYSPIEDRVFMPDVGKFPDINQFYATLSHELIHWTGAKHRLNRTLAKKGTVDYAKEEVLAEIGNVYLCYQLGIKPDFPQSTAYIRDWKEQVKKSKNLIEEVAVAARAATDYIISFAPELFAEIVKENTRRAEERSKMDDKIAKPGPEKANTTALKDSEAKTESPVDDAGKTKAATTAVPSKPNSTDAPVKAPATATSKGPIPEPQTECQRFAIVAAAAISERIPASDPVHKLNLIDDIAAFADRAAQFEDPKTIQKAQTITVRIALHRAFYEAKKKVAQEAVLQDPRGGGLRRLDQEQFDYAQAGRTRQHPLPYAHQDVKDFYDDSVLKAWAELRRVKPHPTAAEVTIGKINAMPFMAAPPNRPVRNALEDIFLTGRLREPQEVIDERNTLAATLLTLDKAPPKDDAELLLKRIFSAFTHQELEGVIAGEPPTDRSAFVMSDPDGKYRTGLTNVMAESCSGNSLNAWHPVAKELEAELHPTRYPSKSQMSLGL